MSCAAPINYVSGDTQYSIILRFLCGCDPCVKSNRCSLLQLSNLRVEFLLKTDSGYPRDAEVTLFTLATLEHSLRFNTH